MALKNTNFTILADVEADTSKIQQQLQKQKLKIEAQVDGKQSIDDLTLSVNASNEVFREGIQIITSFVDEVFKLDDAITEFKKVSDLRGSGLEQYTEQLGEIGKTVARTKSEMIEATT